MLYVVIEKETKKRLTKPNSYDRIKKLADIISHCQGKGLKVGQIQIVKC